MRIYRRSPLYPRWGPILARCLARLRPLDGRGLVVKDIGGVRFELDLSEVIDASLYYSQTFEEGAEAVIAELVKPGMMAVDVGANIGYHTFRMARLVGSNG